MARGAKFDFSLKENIERAATEKGKTDLSSIDDIMNEISSIAKESVISFIKKLGEQLVTFLKEDNFKAALASASDLFVRVFVLFLSSLDPEEATEARLDKLLSYLKSQVLDGIKDINKMKAASVKKK